MNTSRILGAILCIASAAIAVAHIFFGYIQGSPPPLAFALPVTVGLLAVVVLGFWLGWIMATTKEVTPATETEASEKTEKSE